MTFAIEPMITAGTWQANHWDDGWTVVTADLRRSAQFEHALLVTQTGGFLGYLLFGLVADWIGRRPAYSVYSGVRAVGLVMITLFWDTVVVYPPLILTFMFLVGLGSGSYGGYGPLFTELFDTSIRNTAMGSAFNVARGIQFFTPVIIAVIAKQYGLGGGIFLATIFSLLTGIWIWTFPETKGRKLLSP